jgi:hypothetical protein
MANAIEKIRSPKGSFEWVFIDGEGKENLSGKFKYTLNLVLSEEAAQPLVDQINAFWEANKPAGFKKDPKSLGFKPHTVKKDDAYVPTGKVNVVFGTDVAWPDGTTKVVEVYNAKANKISLMGKKIGNGSEGYVSGAMGIYSTKAKEAGVTLYLNAVQLTKFLEFSTDAGFAAEEDGFTGEDEDTGFEQQPDNAPAKPRL